MSRPIRQWTTLVMMFAVMTSQTMSMAQGTPEAPGDAPPAVQTFFTHWAVAAISPVMRLPDAPPVDGRLGGEVRIILAQDEY